MGETVDPICPATLVSFVQPQNFGDYLDNGIQKYASMMAGKNRGVSWNLSVVDVIYPWGAGRLARFSAPRLDTIPEGGIFCE